MPHYSGCKTKKRGKMDLETLYSNIDDFVINCPKNSKEITFIKQSTKGGIPRMGLAELMTIMVLYHSSQFKNFKHFYFHLKDHHLHDFPKLISYNRYVELIPCLLIPLTHFLQSKMGQCSGISYVDSTSIKVCKNIRINRNKVFGSLAKRGKSSMGWFFGFKLHIVVNTTGELLSFAVTQGNVDDRVPVPTLCKRIFGKLFGDKGYLGKKLFADLMGQQIQMITNIKSNMKQKFISIHDKILLRKRFVIETINDQLKNISDIEHSRHRSPINFLVNIIAGLVSYTYQNKKPAIKMPRSALALI